ncbi:MAG: hypothetical protein ACK5WZ_15715 [Pseudobdellovibrionaceae bacterium]
MDKLFYVFGFSLSMAFILLTFSGGRVSDYLFDPSFSPMGRPSAQHK